MLKRIRKSKHKYTRETLRALLLTPRHCSCPTPLEAGCKPKFAVSSVKIKPVFNTPNISTFLVTTQTCLSLIAGSSSSSNTAVFAPNPAIFSSAAFSSGSQLPHAWPPLQPSSSHQSLTSDYTAICNSHPLPNSSLLF